MTPLRRRMTEDMQVRNLTSHTQATYVQQVSLFARHFNQSPEILGPEEIRSYQVYLMNERKLAPSSIIIAVSALRFLYKITLHRDWSLQEVIPTPKKPQRLPIVPSPEEVLQFLGCVRNIKHRTILTVCYAAGLRVSEAVCLKVTDIDSKRMVVRVQQGKGRIDRYVMLSSRLLQILRDWWAGGPTRGMALSGRPGRQPHRQARCRVGMPEGASTLPYSQTDHTPLSSARICSPSAGIGYRPAHDPTAVGSSQPCYHGHLSTHRHYQGLLDQKPARSAPTDAWH